MSHFCGLVILTPKYEKDIDDSLEKYNENVEVQEYCADKVSKADKKRFVKYYTGKRFYTKKSFEELYAEKGAEWNSNQWRKDEKGVWQVYSTYNPNSKWDWWCFGGRWTNCIKTKSGEFVNEAMFGEIDFTDDKSDCFSLKNPPYCVVIDGKWYEKGQMGWWGMTSNEKNDDDWEKEIENLLATLPEDSDVYNVDFHI